MTLPTEKQQGFTLLELIVAISIFGVISVMAYGALRHISDTAFHLEKRSEQLADLQRAFFVINKDFQQLANRTIRDEYGDQMGALEADGDGRIEFTRAGWRNPSEEQAEIRTRSYLQRVAYRLEDEVLHRDYWRVLDRAQDSKALSTDIIHGVEAFEVLLFDGNEWQPSWPPLASSNAPASTPVASLPTILKITVTLQGVGKVWKFYSLVKG